MLTHSLQSYLDSDFSSASGLRSNPRQDRSKQSLNVILRATADLIDESGYASVTTAEVAKRTGLAIGTVYRFFPDRIALMFGVYDHVLKGFLDIAVARLAESSPQSWQDSFATILTASAEARRTIPGYQSVHHRILGETGDSERYRERITGIGTAIAGELSTFGLPSSEEWVQHVTVAYELSLSLQRLAFDMSPSGDERLLGEAVSLPLRYLSEHLDEQG
ncbi:TetR/AcrR family transcriptional regulator [Mycetocola reblochoni]|uniref:Transcriptional regulator, TetR family n=1 Tax=Mycetocola reblochoni REB411 TaxID=1255698 RepID=A0A1R4J4N0_9MICO|nr:TetR/AcrR family transcriptional regulator [Mycetocola reblochoni]SJN27007.1 Transcriptional regulator, TetR family [Mycetocola reblochoni REB411]